MRELESKPLTVDRGLESLKIKPQFKFKLFSRRLASKRFKMQDEGILFGGDTMSFKTVIDEMKIPEHVLRGEKVSFTVTSGDLAWRTSMDVGDKFEGVVGIKIKIERTQ